MKQLEPYVVPKKVKETDFPFRFKPEMWSKVAEEMAVPWRAAEAMHWQLGEADMARASPSHSHSHSQSQSSAMSTGSSSARYSRPATAHSGSSSAKGSGGGSARTIAARRDSTPRSVPPASPSDGMALAAIGGGMSMGMGRGGLLPSVAEMTTGVSPYNTPAYSTSMPMGGGYSSPGPLLPSIGMMDHRQEEKRRGSPDMGPRDPVRRRQ
jgi:hypothetical protein